MDGVWLNMLSSVYMLVVFFVKLFDIFKIEF